MFNNAGRHSSNKNSSNRRRASRRGTIQKVRNLSSAFGEDSKDKKSDQPTPRIEKECELGCKFYKAHNSRNRMMNMMNNSHLLTDKELNRVYDKFNKSSLDD